ncbi:DUF167 domain-containing protein [Legionella cardiaca]|uniref:UPF0235 protein PXX05_00160 n=1 Tax=Legionella cardiaca TaxID=1071983 RepID=A0ABY8ATX9_9GAMM|nr:DUF167 domain-containing protein [Legionella cardiaca]WED43224.1 DUF167 domain-containing protein [Legionella cardiaca]
MNCPLWLKYNAQQLTLQIKVKPGAKQNKISFDSVDCLQISLQASPQDGKANKMLIQYLANLLGVMQKQITILYGTTSRNKVLGIKVVAGEQERLIKYFMEQLHQNNKL